MSRTIGSPIPFSGVPSDDMEKNLPAPGFRWNSKGMEDDLSVVAVRPIISRRMVPDQPDDPPEGAASVVSTKKKPSVNENAPKNLPLKKPPSTAPALKAPVVTKPPSTAPALKAPAVTKPPSTAPALKAPAVTKPPSTTPALKAPAVTKPPSTPPALKIPVISTPPIQGDEPDAALPGEPAFPVQQLSPLTPPPSPGETDTDTLPEPVLIPSTPVRPAGDPLTDGIDNQPVEFPGGEALPEVTAGSAGSPVQDPTLETGAEPVPGSLNVTPSSPKIDFLTATPANVFNDEQLNMEGRPGLLSSIGDFFRDLVGTGFSPRETAGAPEVNYIPVVFPTVVKPPVVSNPVESFRAGYISQRDLEAALGREDWTMCCATTFLYAVQTKYPGLSREKIIDAAGKAAKTELADGSGPCVNDDGYVASIHQYSQALSRELGLKDYVDTPGEYPSVEAARAAGVKMMKVELSGTVDHERIEHHVFLQNNFELDPIGTGGIDKLLDEGSRQVESAMALDWYQLP